MTTWKCLLGVRIMMVGWSLMGWIAPDAHAQGIPSVPPGNNTVTLIQTAADGRDIDVTDKWLPEPGVPVQILVNGAVPGSVSLIPPPSGVVFDGLTNPFLSPLTTSGYPGQCTNFANPTFPQNAPDFTLSGNELTPTDCGGMAVIDIGGQKFVLPQDTDLDGIPNIYEAQMCPDGGINCLLANEDKENPPVFDTTPPNILKGDGIAAFDEYRGFIVSGVHKRMDPRQKELFVHLVNPQCGSISKLGGGTGSYPTDGIPLFGNLNTLISDTQIHLLGFNPGANNGTTTEWIDRFVSYTENATGTGGTFSYNDGTSNAPANDRQINAHALFPVPEILTASKIQKGLRITECLASTTAPDPILGSAGHGSPNGPDNALIYPQRIIKKIDDLIAAGAGRAPFLDRFDGNPAQATDRNIIISYALRYFIAMEIGHAVRLTPQSQGTRSVNYGYHHAPGTGCNLDQNLLHKVAKQSTGPQTFYIPTAYCQVDQSNARHHD